MPNPRDYDALFKLVLVGDISVGKSCLLLKFADDSFSDSYIATIGVDFRFRSLRVDEKVVKLQIWDTAGQERFRTITSAYYKGADGIVVVYDRSVQASFDAIDGWLEEIAQYNGPETSSILIVGNKGDLEAAIGLDKAKAKFAEKGITVVEASAKSGEGVEDAFEAITKTLLDRKIEKETKGKVEKWNANIALTDAPEKESNCCL